MWCPPLGEEALSQQGRPKNETHKGNTVIEYELIQQQVHELQVHAEHQRLVREAKEARRGLRRPVAARFQRRAARKTEC